MVAALVEHLLFHVPMPKMGGWVCVYVCVCVCVFIGELKEKVQNREIEKRKRKGKRMLTIRVCM